MTSEKVQSILLSYKDLIPSDKVLAFKSALERASDSDYDKLILTKTYNPTTTLLLSIFLGGFGVDRFYIGDVGVGVCKLLFGWLTFGIWPLVDIFCCYKKSKEKNLQNLLSALDTSVSVQA